MEDSGEYFIHRAESDIIEELKERPKTYKEIFWDKGYSPFQKEYFDTALVNLMDELKVAYNTSAREYSLVPFNEKPI